MSSEKIPCAVLGASGYIGQHFVRLLHDHPTFELSVLGAGERSEGKRLRDVWQLAEDPPTEFADAALVHTTPQELEHRKIRVVFSAMPSGTAEALETECVDRGIAVFSNAADHRLDPGVPLLVPEVNAEHLELARIRALGRAPLVTNPNCSAAGLVLALAPVMGLLDPKAVFVATYQALSGAGFPGVPSLSITDNVVPYIPEEEEKVSRESALMLGRLASGKIRPLDVPFVAQCARVAVREGHLEAVTVESRRSPKLEEILAAWSSFDPLARDGLSTSPHPPIIVRTEVDRPQPLRDRWAGEPERARGMAVVVGRPRFEPPYLRFFVLSHNAVRGGAGGSVLNAELAVARGILSTSKRPRKG